MNRLLKTSLKRRRFCYGSWITLGSPALAEIMAQAGFQWLTIDLEHSAIDIATAQTIIQVVSLSGCAPLVRLTGQDPNLTKRVMDSGACGVIVPMVNTADEARAAVRSVHYPPMGGRSVGLARAQGYGASFERYRRDLRANGVVIVQIEHREAVENIEDILKVPGIDAIFMGPYDLSASYGIPGRFEHPLMRKALRTVLAAAERAKVCAGIHVVQPSIDEVSRRLKQGFRFIAFSSDILMLGNQCREAGERLRRLK